MLHVYHDHEQQSNQGPSEEKNPTLTDFLLQIPTHPLFLLQSQPQRRLNLPRCRSSMLMLHVPVEGGDGLSGNTTQSLVLPPATMHPHQLLTSLH